MSDSSPSTTCTITCAACGRQEVRPTLRAVYGEDNPFPGDDGDAPYADRPGTGWIAALGVYFCPAHVDRPESWGEEMARWEAKLEEHRALFEEKFKLHTPPPSLRLEDGGGDAPMSNPLSLPVHLSDWKLTPTTTLDGLQRADGASGDVAATKWPADVSLFVNDDSDGTQIDVWHDGVCGGPMLTANSMDAARAIIGAIDELHGLRERLADFQADYRKVMSDQCAPDERHCSCVPHLRARIAELERERVDLKRDLSNAEHAVMLWRSAERSASSTARNRGRIVYNKQREIETLTAQLDAARVEIAHLQDTLIKLREGAPTPPATPAPPDPNALPGGGEGAVTALLMDYGIVDTPETRQQMRDTLMSALRTGAGPDGYYPLRTTEGTGAPAPAWLRLEWSGASIDPVPYAVDTLPRPATPYVPEPPSRVGGRWVSPSRVRVFVDVHDERERQDRKFGRDRNHPLAYSGFRGRPQDLCAAYGLPSAQEAQARCDAAMKAGRVTYGHILVEEVCEVFEAAAEGDMVAVRKELVQVVAVGVAAIEALDRAEGR